MTARDLQIADKQSTPLGIIARLSWMLLGNVVLAFSALFIYQNEGGFFHAADWVFWITVATLVLIRYLDIRFLNGQTAMGECASITHWVRYAALLIACSTAVWVLAHTVNYLFVRGASQG